MNVRKPKGSAQNFGDYRPICLLTSTYKIFSTLIYLRVLREVEGFIGKWQAEFRQRRGYVDNTVVLLALLRHCKVMGERVFATMADIEKVFDSINHTAIVAALIQAGASRKIVALIMDMHIRKSK